LGFYLPQEGQIRLDGRDIRHLAANELRQTFGVVPQETVLFAGTLYENEPWRVSAQAHMSAANVMP
jgi:subfamily B ATP-binding cassette protein HlyB/CyaB